MEHWINKVALITNCKNEIGLKITKILVESQLTVIGFCEMNSEDPLMEYENLFMYKCDFSNIDSIQSAFNNAMKKHGGVDVLINNINCEPECLVSNGNLKVIQKITDENISSTVTCIRLAAETMIKRETRGHIIILREQEKPGDLRSVVRATNAAIESVNEIIRQEFRYLNVNIKTTHVKYCAEKYNLDDVGCTIKLVLDTPEHLQIHELQIDGLASLKQ